MQISFHEWVNSVLARHSASTLGRDEVQVWMASTPSDQTDFAEFACLLSQDERVRSERFRVREPCFQFVFGRALLRQLLGTCLNIEPVKLAIGYQPRGKPFLPQPLLNGDLRFNLSHSGRILAIALARGREVGVDLESIHHLDDWPVLSERIFSPRELCELRALPKPQQRKAFFNGWTRKEAYLKATGEGLRDDLAAVEVSLSRGDPQLLALPTGPETVRQWEIRSIPLPPDFTGAVVFEKSSIHSAPTNG